jgi:GNAT superfamily N-acetyltransferase
MNEAQCPFIVFGLPRSRTYWLSRFLSFPPYRCHHDMAAYVRSAEDVRAWLSQPATGTVETAAAPFWRLARLYNPSVRFAVVRRDPREVIDSLLRFGCFDRAALARLLGRYDRALDIVESLTGTLSVGFHDLNRRSTCAAMFEHCHGRPMPESHFETFSPINLQCDLGSQLIYGQAFAHLMAAGAQDCIRVIRRHCMRSAAPALTEDGVSIQQERYRDFFADATGLMQAHCLAVGEPADQYTRKNLAMFERLDDRGNLLIMTARLNGRMLGYLVSVIVPSLEENNTLLATQLPFYVGEDARGLNLGIRLQKAAMARAKQFGAKRMYCRAGIRGEGRRIGALYRRLGATDYGQMYEIDLTGTG